MWVIDFGRSRTFPIGTTESNFYGRFKLGHHDPVTTITGITGCNVPVYAGSRPNTKMSKVLYCKNYPETREKKMKNRRLSIAENLKLLNSPRKVSTLRRVKSAIR